MKTSIFNLRIAIVIFVMACMVQTTSAVVKVNSDAPKVEQASDFTPTQITTLNKAQLEQRLGRKLTLKEKIGVVIVKRQVKKRKSNRINAPVPTDGFAIASLVCALVSLLAFGIPLGLMAVIFGGVSQGRIKKAEGELKGKGMATAGMIIGLIGLVVVLAFVASMT